MQGGALSDAAQLEGRRAQCLDEFIGSGAQGMAADKLRGRIEDATREPPLVSLAIERHCRTVLGSTRAERQSWTLDVAARNASSASIGHRQLRPMQARVDVQPLAEEVVRLILKGDDDERWSWRVNGAVPG